MTTDRVLQLPTKGHLSPETIRTITVEAVYLENEILKAKERLYRDLLKQSREALHGAVIALIEQDSCEAAGIRAMIRVLDRELDNEPN